MIFGLVFRFLLRVLKSFHLVVYEFHCIKFFDVVCFFSESNIFENSRVNLFQSDFICIGKTENHFWAAPSSVVCNIGERLCIQF